MLDSWNTQFYKDRSFYFSLHTHIYENHIDAVTDQLIRIPSKFPKLIIDDIDNINEIKETDFEIVEYNYYPTIKAEMIA